MRKDSVIVERTLYINSLVVQFSSDLFDRGLEFGAELSLFSGHGRSVLSVAKSGDGGRKVSGALDETVRIWDAESGSELFLFNGYGVV